MRKPAMYSDNLADVYEMIYRGRGKDWSAEASDIARRIRSRHPAADSLLDVACGTGAHLRTFATLFGRVEGLEIAAPMRERARARIPGVTVHAGDMRAFHLGSMFDAVTCMFVAISYTSSVNQMRDAIRCMAAHLVPGGVLVVEPWWFPAGFVDGYVAGDLAREGGRTVARVSHSVRRGRATHLEARFTVGDSHGIRQFTEVDVMMLFTRQEYESAFEDAGCSVEYLAGEPTTRGLFVGSRLP